MSQLQVNVSRILAHKAITTQKYKWKIVFSHDIKKKVRSIGTQRDTYNICMKSNVARMSLSKV